MSHIYNITATEADLFQENKAISFALGILYCVSKLSIFTLQPYHPLLSIF